MFERPIIAAVLAAACVPCLAQDAAPPPSAARMLLAQARAASGGDAWSSVRTLHVLGRLEGGGRVGTDDRWEDVTTGRWSDAQALPPRSGADGFDGIARWTVGRDHVPYVLGDEDVRQGSADDAFRTMRGWWFPDRLPAAVESAGSREDGGRRYDLVRIVPQGGRPFVLWIDRTTHLIFRDVEQQGEELAVSTFRDYRSVEGLMIPFAVEQGSDATGRDVVQKVLVERVDVNPPTVAARFAMPPSAAGLATLDEAATNIPFRLVGDRLVVQVTLDGQGPFDAEFDSGGSLILPPAVVGRLKSKAVGASRETGGGEGFVVGRLGTVGDVGLGAAHLRQLVYKSFDLDPDQPERILIGQEILQNFVVELDFDRSLMTLRPQRGYVYSGSGAILPFVFQDNQPEVRGSVDGIEGVFAVDTGDSGSLLLLAPFAARYGLVARYGATIPYGGSAVAPTHGVMARVGEVALDGADGHPVLSVSRPVTRISLQKGGWDAHRYVSANLGIGILKQFNIVFDYARQRLILTPNRLHGTTDVYARTGLQLAAAGTGWKVAAIVPGGPAERAGVAVGDEVAAIDGRTRAAYRPEELRDLFRGPVGTRVGLVLVAGGHRRDVELELRDVL